MITSIFTIVLDFLEPALLHGDLDVVQLALLQDCVSEGPLSVQACLPPILSNQKPTINIIQSNRF